MNEQAHGAVRLRPVSNAHPDGVTILDRDYGYAVVAVLGLEMLRRASEKGMPSGTMAHLLDSLFEALDTYDSSQ